MKTARVTGRRHRISGSPQFGFRSRPTGQAHIHLDLFDEEWADLGLSDEDLRGLQTGCLANPGRYPVVRQAGEAFSKIRFTPARAGRGKSSAYRVGYVQFPELGFILLITAWSKNDKSDFSRTDRDAIATLVQDIRMKLKQRRERMKGQGKLTAKGAKIVAALPAVP